MSTRTFSVPGMTCGHCQSAIEGELSQLGGVEQVTVDLVAKTVVVDGSASDDAVTAAIDEAGYEVAGIS